MAYRYRIHSVEISLQNGYELTGMNITGVAMHVPDKAAGDEREGKCCRKFGSQAGGVTDLVLQNRDTVQLRWSGRKKTTTAYLKVSHSPWSIQTTGLVSVSMVIVFHSLQ